MLTKENKFTTWIDSHKEELIIVSSIAITAIGAILVADNWEFVKGAVCGTPKAMKFTALKTSNQNTIIAIKSEQVFKSTSVKEHLRNLPKGHHPSAWKIAAATESGIELAENQTMVSAHMRRYAA